MKVLFLAAIILTTAFCAFGQTDYESRMVEEDKRLLDNLVVKSDSENRAKRIRENHKRKSGSRFVEIDIKAPAEKVNTLITDLLATNGYIVESSLPNRVRFSPTAKIFEKIADGKLDPVQNDATLKTVAYIDGNSRSTKVIVYIGLISQDASRKSDLPNRVKTKKMQVGIRSILLAVKQQAEK